MCKNGPFLIILTAKKSQKLTAVQKWIIFAYFVKKGPKFVSHDSLSRNNEKINYLQKV